MSRNPPVCGQPTRTGRYPVGWVKVQTARLGAEKDPGTWYCGPQCAASALGAALPAPEPEEERRPEVVDVPSALAWANRHLLPTRRLQEVSLTLERVHAVLGDIEQGLEADEQDDVTRADLDACWRLLMDHARVLREQDRTGVTLTVEEIAAVMSGAPGPAR